MAHAIWKGTLSFGLVEIPVVLRGAETRKDLSFTQLDKRSMQPIGYRRYNKTSGEEVEWKDIVRAYELEDGRYVPLTDEELEEADPERSHALDVVQFVDREEIEPVFFETPYYLVPEKAGGKGYPLLREALRKTGRVAIGRLVMRTREHVVAIYPRGNLLIVDLLRYAHEIRDAADVEVPEGADKVKPTPAEAKMAERLVEEMSAPWDPTKFQDQYHDRILDIVRRKAATGKVKDAGEAPKKKDKTGDVLDLMPLLRRSLEREPSRQRAASAAPARRRTSTRATGPARRAKARKTA